MERFIYCQMCPVCSSSSLSLFKKATFDFTRLSREQIKITDSEYGKVWNLSRCQDCRHIFANPFPSPQWLASLYGSVEDPLYEEEASGRRKNFLRILASLEKIKPEKGALFDVGAATGILLSLAQRRGWEVSGVEPSPWLRRVAEEKYGLHLYGETFEDLQLEKGRFAAVTMVDFLEHTAQPCEALLKAGEILAPGGVLCVVTPDGQSLAARLLGLKWWHYRPGHISYFSAESLKLLLSRAGFRIVKKRRYSWTFSLHYLLSRKRVVRFLLRGQCLSSLLKRIPVKLALGDSLEVYAKKEGEL